MQRYSPGFFRVKLSLKCDRTDPHCNRCKDSGFACTYPEKRKARGARHKTEIRRLDGRLEALEERLKAKDSPSDAVVTPSLKHVSPLAVTASASSEADNGPQSQTWLYRMVSGAKDNIETLTSQGQLIPEAPAPWAQNTVNRAITRLDTALTQLAAPSPDAAKGASDDVDPTWLVSDVKRYIETFIEAILPHFTIFDSFSTALDAEFLTAMPHIIDSPLAQIDPAMRIVYYSAIHLGQSFGTLDEQKTANKAYYKCLQSVPKWLASAEGTQLDLLAASLVAWLAINNFDYHLAWQFHAEACRFADRQGIHDVDSLPLGTPQEEAEKEARRRQHWYLVEIDFLFRMWYDKPRALRAPMSQVRLPAEISPRTKQPKWGDCILFIVWSRALYILGEYYDSADTLPGEELNGKIDHCCNQLAELLEDWDLVSVANSPKLNAVKSWLYAESLIAFYSFIIFLRRKASPSDQLLHPQEVHAARAVIKAINEWSQKPNIPCGEQQTFHTHLIIFYPFCAFFTLYYHILSSTTPCEYEGDICELEQVAKIITHVSRVRPDFVPIAEALGALNDVSRAVHSGREVTLSQPPAVAEQSQFDVPAATVQPFPPVECLQNLSSDLPLQSTDPNGMFGVPFQLQNQFTFDWDPSSADQQSVTRPDTAQTISQPLDFVRAIENELIWRNWHESWWNVQQEPQAQDVADFVG
ncbi:hypothetical protein BJY04DRAFT_224316 [Aspergillus karnatakaensis]|uniref:Zn(II)2Cys6 transcription factor n=1 Tax=Aspergillus karnatakaensis TaxID=1810916 RepID=UPI003CCE4F4E